MYLKNMESGDCRCLITEADEVNAGEYWAILGAPFFRNTTVQFNFESHAITIWGKDGNSPIVPSSQTTTDKLGSGAIAGIAIGGFLLLLIIVLCLMYCCCCRGKKESKEVHNYGINEDEAMVNHDDE